MGWEKLGKRKEMVEDRMQEIYAEGRCMKEFRVKVLLVKEVCVRAWCKGPVPRKVKVHVAKCHAAATKASTGNQARHQSQPRAVSAMLATQSGGRCRQAPRLLRKMESATPTALVRTASTRKQAEHEMHAAQCHKCHNCHVK